MCRAHLGVPALVEKEETAVSVDEELLLHPRTLLDNAVYEQCVRSSA